MATLAAFPEPMDVAAFLAFCDTRPDGEKWELLDGELFMNATPVSFHQLIVGNITHHLFDKLRNAGNAFKASAGIGVRLSGFSSVEPDVMIRPRNHFNGRICQDIVVAFEVLSPSTQRNDLKFKRESYPALASLTHYVIVSAERMEVRVYARDLGWAETVLNLATDEIHFDHLGATLSLAQIYDDLAQYLDIPAT